MPIVYSSAKTHSIECVLDFGSNFIPTITLFFIILSWTFFILVRTTNFGLFGFFGYREQNKGWKIMSSVIIEKKRLLVEGQIDPLATRTTNSQLRTF